MDFRYHFDKRPENEGLTFGNIVIHQIGDLYCKYDTVVNQHSQICTELTCVLSGKGLTRINGNEFPLRPGEINIVFHGDKHEIISDPIDPLRFYFFGFSVKQGHALYPALQQLKEAHKNGSRVFSDDLNIRGSISKALAELYTPGEFSEILLETYAKQIIVNTLRSFHNVHPAYRPDLDDKKTLAFSMANFIDKNIESLHSVNDVYKNFSYSASYLAHIFSDAVGVSPSKYFMDARMNLALRLLKQHRSVTKTAELLGYSSRHPFCRAFNKCFGASPSSYIDKS